MKKVYLVSLRRGLRRGWEGPLIATSLKEARSIANDLAREPLDSADCDYRCETRIVECELREVRTTVRDHRLTKSIERILRGIDESAEEEAAEVIQPH